MMIDTTASRIETADLMARITAMHSFFEKNGDEVSAERARDLAVKLNNREFSIAFCGHFSAGKSSMINKIAGEDLLAASPIPTSANLVRIKNGDDYAKILLTNGEAKLYPAPYDYEKIKSYSKDGEKIRTVEISNGKISFPENIVIMDTPGIDSTDDAHRIATESAMHLADIVFYVMDYNHVQSELNFLFTRELTLAGKELYLIINQVDKHQDQELSFAAFKDGVKESFASWGVEPERIFYTSLKHEDHPYNQFQDVKAFLNEIIAQSDAQLPVSVYQSLNKLAGEHLIYIEENRADEYERLEQKLSELTQDEHPLINENYSKILKQLDELRSETEKVELELNEKIEDILKNAYLMPFQTRELAEKYIESRQRDFKVGLFFAKQKTEQERQERLTRFFADFKEKIKAQIDWHMKEMLQSELKALQVNNSALLASVQSYEVTMEASVLADLVKEGARLSGDYVLQYTNEAANAAKKAAKEAAEPIKRQLIAEKDKQTQQEILQTAEEAALWKGFAEALDGLHNIKQGIADAKSVMKEMLNGEYNSKVNQEKIEKLLIDTTPEAEIVTDEQPAEQNVITSSVPAAIDADEQDVTDKSQPASMEALIHQLEYTADRLGTVPGFKSVAKQLVQKAERLAHREFTVALFGAFSAGKSSFANALIGESVLPVSPNPTTAAINKIMPVDALHPHGTVAVYVKREEALFDDIIQSLKVFGATASSFAEALEKIEGIFHDGQKFDANEKTHFAFLRAFSKGYAFFQDKLGTLITTDLPELAEYVANEEKSCFVDMIEVHYDCLLTQLGITLVDTPGADSINARHTGVAFNYIKNSDAILFVTYYNHAFSKADREFLIQLGRVKDAFALDKMFFVVNAVDLANSEEEKQTVLQYVGDQLLQYGIRKPNLFGLSSLLALQEKKSGSSENVSLMREFERAFHSFISNDLMEISVSAARTEWNRAAEQLKDYILASQDKQEQKEQHKAELLQQLSMVKQALEKTDASPLQHRLDQEIQELVYYIKQRVFLRFGDFVKESFNPAVLKDDGRNLKQALQGALADFLSSFGFDFAQELRATTLRIEIFIGKLLQEEFEQVQGKVNTINQSFAFSKNELGQMDGIDFESAFIGSDPSLFKKALSYFKNPKSFFEKNERKMLAMELEQSLQQLADDYLAAECARIKTHYSELLEGELSEMLQVLTEQTNEYYEGLLAAVSNALPIEQLQQIEQDIRQFEN